MSALRSLAGLLLLVCLGATGCEDTVKIDLAERYCTASCSYSDRCTPMETCKFHCLQDSGDSIRAHWSFVFTATASDCLNSLACDMPPSICIARGIDASDSVYLTSDYYMECMMARETCPASTTTEHMCMTLAGLTAESRAAAHECIIGECATLDTCLTNSGTF